MAHILDVRNAGGDLVVIGQSIVLPNSNTAVVVGAEPLTASIRFNPDRAVVRPDNGITVQGGLEAYLPIPNSPADWKWERIGVDRNDSLVMYTSGATMSGDLIMRGPSGAYKPQIALQAGSETLPGLAFDSDRSTGLYYDPVAGTLNTSVAGVNMMVANSTALLIKTDLYATNAHFWELWSELGHIQHLDGNTAVFIDIKTDTLEANTGTIKHVISNLIDVVPVVEDDPNAVTEIEMIVRGQDWTMRHNLDHTLTFDFQGRTTMTLFDNDSVYIDNLGVDHLTANVEVAGTIFVDKLYANTAQIDHLTANLAQIDHLIANLAQIDHLVANVAEIDVLTVNTAVIEQAQIDHLTANTAGIDAITANSTTTTELVADHARINAANVGVMDANTVTARDLSSDEIHAEHFDADSATIDTLIYGSASGDTLQGNTATFTNLTASYAALDNVTIAKGSYTFLEGERLQSDAIIAGTADVQGVVTASGIRASFGNFDFVNARLVQADDVAVANTVVAQAVTVANTVTAQSVVVANAVVANTVVANTVNVTNAFVSTLFFGSTWVLQANTAAQANTDANANTVANSTLVFSANTADLANAQVFYSNGAIQGTAFINALPADMAERYEADGQYLPGTVLVIGGDAEVTTTDQPQDLRVAGVVSTTTAYKLNDGAGTDEAWPYIALAGRVPCNVVGPIQKGDLIVTSSVPGFAQAAADPATTPAAAIIGRALAAMPDAYGTVLIKVN